MLLHWYALMHKALRDILIRPSILKLPYRNKIMQLQYSKINFSERTVYALFKQVKVRN